MRLGRKSRMYIVSPWSKVENIVSTWSKVRRSRVDVCSRGRGSNVHIGFHRELV